MSYVAGLISILEREPFQEVLSRMVTAMHAPESWRQITWERQPAGMVMVSDHGNPRLVERNGVALALVGSVVPDPLLEQRLSATGSGRASIGLASSLLAIYETQGVEGLMGLNGSYAVVIWDAAAFRLTIVLDRYGMQPFYYAHSGGRLVFGSQVKAIASHPQVSRRVDPVAVFDLLAAEQMLDERTLFADIHALPPAGLLTFADGQLQVRSYWQPRLFQPGDPQPGEDEAVEELGSRVLNAVGRLLESAQANDRSGAGNPGALLLLTGGLDSRLVAGALSRCRGNYPVTANTIGHEQARDVRYGRQIAQAESLPHTLLPANPDYLRDYAETCVLRTEGGINVHASWILQESRFLAQSGIAAVLTGVGAEAVSGRHWLAEQPVKTTQEALDRLCEARWTFTRSAALLRPEIRDEAMASARESLQRTLEEAPTDNLLGRSDYFAYRQNRRHPTGSVLAEDALVLEPFFDNDLVDYAFGLPPSLRGQGVLYKKMVVRRFPELATVGYTDSGLALADELSGRSQQTSPLAALVDIERRVYRRAARRLPFLRRGPFGDNPALAIYYNHWMRTNAREYISNLIRREELYADFLDVRRVRHLVEEHMAGRQDNFRLIGGVVTFALWQSLTAIQ